MIGGLIAIGLLVGLVVAAAAAESSAARGRRTGWAKAAEALGLSLRERDPFDLTISGAIGDLDVKVAFRNGSEQSANTRFTVRGPRDLGFVLSMYAYDVILRSKPGLPIDHGELDARFCLLGPPERIYAALSQPVRARLLELGQANISGAELHHDAVGSPLGSEILSTVRHMCGLFQELDVPDARLDARLFETLKAERDPLVARHQMESFFDRPVDVEAYERAVQLGLAHRDREVRLIAARAGGERAVEVVEAIAFDDGADDVLRARALLAFPESALALEVLLELRAVGGPRLREAVARRLTKVKDAAVERALIESLADDVSSVRDAAARALGEIGTLAAVEALRARGGAATAEAVRAIQSRAGGSGPGGLAIVGEDDRGAVSLSADQGALSVKSDD